MAQSPICIITSTGMICLSSPIKEHHPSGQACKAAKTNAARGRKVAAVKASLKSRKLSLPQTKQHVIAKVVELMLAARVDGDTPFTIVKAR